MLKSWAVPKGPSFKLGDKRLAVEEWKTIRSTTPRSKASFPKSNTAPATSSFGTAAWYSPDEGPAVLVRLNRAEAEDRVRKELAAGKLGFFLRGEKLKGSFALVRTTSDPKQWLLLKHKDRFANAPVTCSPHGSRSVLSGSVLDELSPRAPPERMDAGRLAPIGPAEDFPKKLYAHACRIGGRHSDREQLDLRAEARWLSRARVHRERARCGSSPVARHRSRDAVSEGRCGSRRAAVDSMVLDGEITALGEDGGPSFNALQNRAQAKSAQRAR